MEKKFRLLLLLALLLTAATGAWATDVDVYVVGNGTGNWLNGVAWDPGAAGNKMTEQNGVYSITFNNVDANSELQFKFAINGTWAETFGCTSGDANELNKTLSNIEASGNNIAFALTEKADVTISFNLSEMTYMISTKGMKVGDDAAAGYTVSLKDGVKDADKWTVKVGEGQAQALPIGGLKGDGKETVTLQYTGRLKVKGVKATSDAAEASVPDGALSGVFSVSDTKKVYFSKGNLRYASSKWSFFDNQYDYYESHSADAWDKFGWSTSAPTYGMSTSTDNSTYSGDFVDWGATMGAGWFTLSNDEWTYLFNTRTVNGGTGNGKSYTNGQSVNGKLGVVIYPDNYTGEVYSGSDWATFESAGCVFLPAAGRRNGSSMEYAGVRSYYWSATPNGTGYAYGVLSTSDILNPAYPNSRRLGSSVRLVREVATSDEEPAEAVEGHALSAAAVGEIVGSDGKAYAAANKDNLPEGVEAVAMIWYVNGTHGLALALADEADDDNVMYDWETANTLCNAHTPAITGATWKLATQDDWNNMITGAGGAAALRDGFSSVVGENLQNSPYWSSTNYEWDGYAMHYKFNDFRWEDNGKEYEDFVRACLSW